MHSKEYLIENKIFDDSKSYSRVFVARFYMEQLAKFEKLGIGKVTENDIIVTPELIRITKKRLYQLKPILKITAKGK